MFVRKGLNMITILLILGLLLAVIIMFWGLYNERYNFGSRIPIVIGFALGLGCIVTIVIMGDLSNQEFYSSVSTKLSTDNYVLYVNGVEVSLENIDISKYDISLFTVNDEDKKILLATKG